jgi:hypothetical protein
MDVHNLTEGTILLLDIQAIILSIAIIIVNGISVYFCVKAFLCEEMRCDWLFIANAIISFLWILVFLYVCFRCFTGNPVLDHSGFGAMFIRPLIMLSSAGTAITQQIKFDKAKYYGGVKCQKSSKE